MPGAPVPEPATSASIGNGGFHAEEESDDLTDCGLYTEVYELKTSCLISRLAVVVAIHMVGAGERVSADPILLASYDVTGGGEIALASLPQVQLVLQLSPENSPSQSYRLGTGVFWEDDAVGSIDFAPGMPESFSEFASLATNGIDDEFGVLALFAEGGGGSGGPESWLFAESPDLVGNELENVRLIVHDLQIAQSTQYPEGFEFDYALTYEFYGSPVPGPRTLTCLVMGVSMLKRSRMI